MATGLTGCNRFDDEDFTTKCAGTFYFRGFDADATHSIEIPIPSSWVAEAEGAPADIPKTIDFPTSDPYDQAQFLIGENLDDIDLAYCTNLGQPPPGTEKILPATGGHADVVMHPAGYWRNVTADITVTNVTFSDGEETVTVESYTMEDGTIGHSP